MSQNRLRTLAEIAIFSALALILDHLPLFTMPQGGSVSLVMLPILLLSIRHGLITGIISGAIVGTIQLFYGGYFLNAFQVFLDYALSYAGIGVAGLFAERFRWQQTVKAQALYLGLATLVGAGLRFLGNFLAGVIFYGDYAPEGVPIWLYSFQYNISYILPSALLSFFLLFFLLKAQPRFFKK